MKGRNLQVASGFLIQSDGSVERFNAIRMTQDVNNVFSQGDLQAEAYMKGLEGMRHDNSKNLVCKLKKIYMWLQAVASTLVVKTSFFFGYKCSNADNFLCGLQDNIVLLLVYVYDIAMTGNSRLVIERTKKYLHQKFEIKDL